MAQVAQRTVGGPNTPFFARADGQPVSRDQMARAVKRAAAGCGRDPARYSTHSWRSGGATALVAQGVSVAANQRLGRWTSDTWVRYSQDTRGATAGVAELMVAADDRLLGA